MTCTALKFPHNDNPVVTSAAKCIVRTVPSQMLQSTVSESRADSDYFRNATAKRNFIDRLECLPQKKPKFAIGASSRTNLSPTRAAAFRLVVLR
jgi:hypothetical protein